MAKLIMDDGGGPATDLSNTISADLRKVSQQV